MRFSDTRFYSYFVDIIRLIENNSALSIFRVQFFIETFLFFMYLLYSMQSQFKHTIALIIETCALVLLIVIFYLSNIALQVLYVKL